MADAKKGGFKEFAQHEKQPVANAAPNGTSPAAKPAAAAGTPASTPGTKPTLKLDKTPPTA